MVVSMALIIWKGLICITGSESPVVVVLSGSMEPGFKRGQDIPIVHRVIEHMVRLYRLLMVGSRQIVWSPDSSLFDDENLNCLNVKCETEAFHVLVHERRDSKEVDILTKGDANLGDDRMLYASNRQWLQQKHIMGRAVGFLPYAGWFTIIMKEKPVIKYILVGALGLLVITSKE
ncbi:hypothetical protein V6N13_095264 [Hibiscus sabdariffa]